MALSFQGRWVWDFWFAQRGTETHIFYLQADRALRDEAKRHWNVSVGHAVSTNLMDWQVLPDALSPSPLPQEGQPEAPDSYTTWTGSVIQQDDRWFLFYTGGKWSENGLVQRVCLATSTDLITWEKYPENPIIEADSQWYELLDLNLWHDQAWRDPFVFQHPETGRFHAFITARRNTGPADARGVIGHAVSDDLLHWEVKPPVFQSASFGQLEVPQLAQINGRYYLLFSCYHEQRSNAFKSLLPRATNMFYAIGETPLGPFQPERALLALEDDVPLYSGKFIQHQGQWYCMGFQNYRDDGEFVGLISHPLPLTVHSDSSLSI